MIWFLGVMAYAMVGTYSAFVNEPYWKKHFRAEPETATFLFSGLLWPLSPFFKFCIKKRQSLIDAETEQAEREKETNAAEAEVEDALK